MESEEKLSMKTNDKIIESTIENEKLNDSKKKPNVEDQFIHIEDIKK